MNALARSVTLSKYSNVARGLGIDPERITSHVGLDRQCLFTPDLRVPEASLAEVLEVSARSPACAAVGLMIGESWRLSDFGVLGLLLQHQPTLRQALAELKRYRYLLSDTVVIDVAEFPGVAVLHLSLLTIRPSRQPMEVAIGALLSLCRFQLGPQWQPRRVHFTHAAPPSIQAHQRAYGPSLEFDSEFNGIVLSADDLDRVNPASDADMARYAQAFIDMQPRGEERGIVHEVRRSVNALLPHGRGHIDQVSQSLGLSTRTLQRQLEQTGDSFQALVNEVRREQAIRYLEGRTHTIAQITQLLGFAETSAFSRWFSQQFSMPPSRWGRS